MILPNCERLRLLLEFFDRVFNFDGVVETIARQPGGHNISPNWLDRLGGHLDQEGSCFAEYLQVEGWIGAVQPGSCSANFGNLGHSRMNVRNTIPEDRRSWDCPSF